MMSPKGYKKYQLNFVLLGLLLAFIILTGCNAPESRGTLSNPELHKFSSHLDTPVITATESPLKPDLIIKNNQTWIRRGADYALAQNATAYLKLDDNTPYELSLGAISLQPNETQSTVPSYIMKINVTLINSGTIPVQVTFATLDLMDDSGDGCHSKGQFTCGVLFLGPMNKSVNYIDHRLNPGGSDTQTLNVTLFSTKGYDYLSSQKYFLSGMIDATTNNNGRSGERVAWWLDLNNT